MGLAGPRNRTKIGVDPRNTNWSNNTNRFGHRILTTLGWQPGNTLGDTSSLYHQSGHITTASATGVRIVLKDDNLGIGCNKRQREDECVGLHGFQSILGRLNSKDDDELGRKAETRERMRRETIVGERYGMRFVRGETYVSSDIETLIKRIKGEGNEGGKREIVVKNVETKEAKKRKRREIKDEEMGGSDEITTIPTAPLDVDTLVATKKDKQKKIKREESLLRCASVTPAPGGDSDSKSKKRKLAGGEEIGKSTKGKKDKIPKRSKNGETREQRKERRSGGKKARKAGKKEKEKQNLSSSHPSISLEDEPTPAASGAATPSSNAALVGRQAVRHRYIAANRSVVMDAKALNEIFMIKG